MKRLTVLLTSAYMAFIISLFSREVLRPWYILFTYCATPFRALSHALIDTIFSCILSIRVALYIRRYIKHLKLSEKFIGDNELTNRPGAKSWLLGLSCSQPWQAQFLQKSFRPYRYSISAYFCSIQKQDIVSFPRNCFWKKTKICIKIYNLNRTKVFGI